MKKQLAWHDKSHSKKDAGAALMTIVASFEQTHTLRRWEACELYRMYKGDTVGRKPPPDSDIDGIDGFEPLADNEVRQSLNIAKDLVDTLISKLCATENVKPQIVVTEGSWDTRRRARLADRFIEGQMQLQQGKHSNLWSVFEHALRIAISATRTSAVKFYSDPERGKVCAEIHDTLSMVMDTTASVYDEPSWLAEAQLWEPGRLCAMFPGNDEAIWGAAEPYARSELPMGLESVDDDYCSNARSDGESVYRVKVAEGWHFAVGSTPGRHVIAINGHTLLDDRKYEYEDSPFVFVGGVKELTGFWHQTLTRSVAPAICRANELLETIDILEMMTPKKTRYYDPQEHNKEDLEEADDAVLVPVVGLARGVKPPVDSNPQLFHPQFMELVQFYISKAYGLSGINEFNTSGQIKGEWSGVALRLMKEQLVERFATTQREYINASVIESAQKIARCAKEVVNSSKGKKFTSAWKGGEFISEIDASVLDLLDDQQYTVDTYPVGEKKNTPEDRVQLFEDLAKTGIVTGDSVISIIKYYDTMGTVKGDDAQSAFIEKQIDKWLYAEPEELTKKGFFRGPIRTMDQASAIVQVNKAYIGAMTDEVDQKRLDYFGQFIGQCEAYQKELESMKAQLAGTMDAPLPPGPPPGPPGMPPPPPGPPGPPGPPPGPPMPPPPMMAG